jgi:hypothetical protein
MGDVDGAFMKKGGVLSCMTGKDGYAPRQIRSGFALKSREAELAAIKP